ncbi:MAG: tRNA (adenosine(37)-N6)-threonylcarbamoyltransferase complex dimerization subunit type 1 TsaB [Gammaproteobacteria bacterium]|nr:tRNA (adenosine(37)-N6)-threonylcarbamoyltransferase complex dimerization subunit type 1 TsaB [Gammaproteobacteria bacterium]
MRLLALDSAGSSSSAVIWQDGEIRAREAASGAHHSEQLLVLIERCLATAGCRLTRLHAIACGRGPGAFTGVRLALAVAQGLAYAAGLRIIPVSNLQASAERAGRVAGAPARLLVCQDARMQEVYWAAFERDGDATRLLGAEAVAPPAQVALPPAWTGAGEIWGIGSGFDACAAGLEPLAGRLARRVVLEGDAEDVARIAARLGCSHAVEPEQAVPVYLRDAVAQAPVAAPRCAPE